MDKISGLLVIRKDDEINPHQNWGNRPSL